MQRLSSPPAQRTPHDTLTFSGVIFLRATFEVQSLSSLSHASNSTTDARYSTADCPASPAAWFHDNNGEECPWIVTHQSFVCHPKTACFEPNQTKAHQQGSSYLGTTHEGLPRGDPRMSRWEFLLCKVRGTSQHDHHRHGKQALGERNCHESRVKR